jgi:regulator of sirC expression with transglutaminase-like and TPR domain
MRYTPPKLRPFECNPLAFDMLARQLPVMESTASLVRAAVAVSMHALDDVDVTLMEKRLEEIATRVKSRVHSSNLQAYLAHLHQVLFEEEGFVGNIEDYCSPLNSYLPAVLESRLGIPVSLCLVYKAVAEAVGLSVVGLNLPGHFLVAVRDGHEPLIVDPFLKGQALTTTEVAERLPFGSRLSFFGQEIAALPVATHRQWISRLIANLQHLFAATGRATDLKAMCELQQLVQLGAAQ